jgi:hypothetical protein
MRAFLVAASIALAASCALPAATVLPGSGGAGGSSTSASSTANTSSSSTGGNLPPPPMVASAAVITQPSTAASMFAPTGNPGQRHLIFGANGWWAFYIVPQGIAYRRSDTTGLMWGPEIPAVPFDFGPGGSVDARSFGMDTTVVNGIDVVHFSLSSGNFMNPLSHARTILSLGGLTMATAEPVLTSSDVSAFAGDGTITSIGQGAPGAVTDFTSVPTHGCASCAILAANAESGAASWSFGAGAVVGFAGTGNQVQMRAAVSLQGGGFVFWRENTILYSAPDAPADAGAGQPLSNAGPDDSSRTFAACPQFDRARVLYWDSGGFTFLTFNASGIRNMEAAPPKLSGLTELVIVCGSQRVHAFAIDDSDNRTIYGASWDTSRWSGWSKVVDPGAGMQTLKRCFLTGFDRVANGQAGLAWSEMGNCAMAEEPRIWGAFPTVIDG